MHLWVVSLDLYLSSRSFLHPTATLYIIDKLLDITCLSILLLLLFLILSPIVILSISLQGVKELLTKRLLIANYSSSTISRTAHLLRLTTHWQIHLVLLLPGGTSSSVNRRTLRLMMKRVVDHLITLLRTSVAILFHIKLAFWDHFRSIYILIRCRSSAATQGLGQEIIVFSWLRKERSEEIVGISTSACATTILLRVRLCGLGCQCTGRLSLVGVICVPSPSCSSCASTSSSFDIEFVLRGSRLLSGYPSSCCSTITWRGSYSNHLIDLVREKGLLLNRRTTCTCQDIYWGRVILVHGILELVAGGPPRVQDVIKRI